MSTNGHHPDTNGRDPLRADEWLEARHAANREQTSPFARGRRLTVSPTCSACNSGVKCPSGGGIRSTKISSSGSRGDETIEYGRSMPPDPSVQYWPGSNGNGSAVRSQILKWSAVRSTRFTIVALVTLPLMT